MRWRKRPTRYARRLSRNVWSRKSVGLSPTEFATRTCWRTPPSNGQTSTKRHPFEGRITRSKEAIRPRYLPSVLSDYSPNSGWCLIRADSNRGRRSAGIERRRHRVDICAVGGGRRENRSTLPLIRAAPGDRAHKCCRSVCASPLPNGQWFACAIRQGRRLGAAYQTPLPGREPGTAAPMTSNWP